MSDKFESAGRWLQKLSEKMQADVQAGSAPKVEDITVRQLLEKFGYIRRGNIVIREIRRILDKYDLRISPDFEFEYIDNLIQIQLDDDGGLRDEYQDSSSPTIHVDSLEAAHNDPVCVSPSDSVVKATTLMRMRCFSQLPVMTTPTEVKGVISWRSIGKAHADGRDPERVGDCMEDAHEINTRTTLSDAVHEVWKHDYVLVRGRDKKITGIVTAADLADQFRQLAHPFLLVGEIEHHLRNVVNGRFTVEQFASAAKGEQEVRGPDDLTFGGYCRLLQNPESWSTLGLTVDRREFVKCLDRVRTIRNDIMHFSPDGIGDDDVMHLEQMAGLLRELAQTRAPKLRST